MYENRSAGVTSPQPQGGREEASEENYLAADPRDIMSRGFGIAPQLLFRDERVSCQAKAIYGYLSSFAGAGPTAFPSKELMLRELSMSRPTFDKHLKQLEAFGYVRVHRRRGQNNQYLTNIYELMRAPAVDAERLRAYKTARARALARSRAQYLSRKEAAAGVEERAVRLAEDILAEVFGIEACIGECSASSSEPSETTVDKLSTAPAASSGEPVSNSFALAKNPSSEPVINSFTLDGPVQKSFTGPVSNSFTPNNNKGNNINHSIPEVDSLAESGAVENSDPAGIPPSGREEDPALRAAPRPDLDSLEFARLAAVSIKPARGAVLQKAREAWAARLAEGYDPDGILSAYDAYRRTYFERNSSVKYAKQLDRWLLEGDGLASYALIAGTGPDAPVLDEAVRREVARRSDAEGLSAALASVDETYRKMRDDAERARVRACESHIREEWDVFHVLSDRAMTYLIQHDRRARAVLAEQVRGDLREAPPGASGDAPAAEALPEEGR